MYKIYSTAFLSSDFEAYNCYVDSRLWARINNDITTPRVVMRFIHGDKQWYTTLGAPIESHNDPMNTIYLPKWMCSQLNIDGAGEELEVEYYPCDVFDESTKIVLQPYSISSQVPTIDDILSVELTKLGVLLKNSTICLMVNGMEAKFEVISLEPANIVLCQGNEVALDFLEPFDALPDLFTQQISSAPLDETPSAPFEEQPAGNSLGGVARTERYNPWRDKDFKPKTS